MNDFNWTAPTRVYFGRGVESKAGEYVRAYGGSRVLLHYGGSHAKKSGLIGRIAESLVGAGLQVTELAGVQPNPRLSLVREGIALCREKDIDFIFAVGGGSAIDSAKAVAMGIPYTGDVWDFFTGRAQVECALPVGTVLTLPAAGSEVSVGTSITNEEGWYKRSINDLLLCPKFSLLNPELTFSLSPYQTACGVADMLSHMMEVYFTNVPETELSDSLCEAAMRAVIRNARRVMKTPDDYAPRAELMWASSVAQLRLFSAGRKGDWGTHSMGKELSGLYDIAHGETLALLFPNWMRRVLRHDPARFIRFAREVWGVDERLYAHGEAAALEGIARLEAFFRELGFTRSLSQLGVKPETLKEMAKKAAEEGPLGSFLPLGEEDVLEIYRAAL